MRVGLLACVIGVACSASQQTPCGFDPTCSGEVCADSCPDGLICGLNGACSPPRYVVSDGGTVTDDVTGLTWQRDSPTNQCPADPDGYCTWAHAASYCETLQLGGFTTGWTLPTPQQLFTLVEDGTVPTIDTTAFPGVGQSNGAYDYWTSVSPHSGYVWFVDFYSDYVNVVAVNNAVMMMVRCVR